MPQTSVFPGGVSEKEDEVKYWQEHFVKFGLHREHLQRMLLPSLTCNHTGFANQGELLKDVNQVLERSVDCGIGIQL